MGGPFEGPGRGRMAGGRPLGLPLGLCLAVGWGLGEGPALERIPGPDASRFGAGGPGVNPSVIFLMTFGSSIVMPVTQKKNES